MGWGDADGWVGVGGTGAPQDGVRGRARDVIKPGWRGRGGRMEWRHVPLWAATDLIPRAQAEPRARTQATGNVWAGVSLSWARAWAKETSRQLCVRRRHVRLPAGKPSFKPTFQECEDIVRNILDNAVLAVAGLPRVGSNTVGSTSFTPPAPGSVHAGMSSGSTIPTTSLQEESVVVAKKVRGGVGGRVWVWVGVCARVCVGVGRGGRGRGGVEWRSSTLPLQLQQI